MLIYFAASGVARRESIFHFLDVVFVVAVARDTARRYVARWRRRLRRGRMSRLVLRTLTLMFI